MVGNLENIKIFNLKIFETLGSPSKTAPGQILSPGSWFLATLLDHYSGYLLPCTQLADIIKPTNHYFLLSLNELSESFSK